MLQFQAQRQDTIKEPRFFFLVERKDILLTKLGLLQVFTACQRPVLNVPKEIRGTNFIQLTAHPEKIIYIKRTHTVHVPKNDSDIADITLTDPSSDYYTYGIVSVSETVLELVKLNDDANQAAFSMIDEFYIEDGMIANYTESKPLLTDVGKFLCNFLLFADPFGDKIPYFNEMFVPEKVDAKVSALIISGKAGRAEYNKYINTGYWFGEDGSISTQGLSEKALGTDPKILQRKKELLEQYKDNLHDPLVLSKIEKELIDMDKAYLKGDESEPFFMAQGGKAFKEHRKKMFILFGMSPDFAKDSNKINFTPSSLEDGYKIDELPNVANEIRRGSYGRGIKTAEGGAESKFILRVFQDTKITEPDCHTKRGMPVTITETNCKQYIGRYLTDGACLSADNIKSYVGKTVKMRSPMSCSTKDGFCYKCCGKIFEDLQMDTIGMQTLTIAEGMIGTAMKSMHQSSLSTVDIKDITRFIK